MNKDRYRPIFPFGSSNPHIGLGGVKPSPKENCMFLFYFIQDRRGITAHDATHLH